MASDFVGFVRGEPGVAPRGKVLVFPLLSIGNVPQIAVDLLVNSFKLGRIGVIPDDAVEPMASSKVYLHTTGLSFACELFQFGEDVVLLQLRSKLKQNQIGAFCSRLIAFVESQKWELSVLGSADSGWLSNPADRLNVKFTATEPETANLLEEMGLKALCWDAKSTGAETMRDSIFAKNTLADLLREKALAAKLPTSELVLFCSEGENVPEGVMLAEVLVDFLSRRKLLAEPMTHLVPVALPAWMSIVRDDNPETIRALFQ
jgi:hypothetical protein